MIPERKTVSEEYPWIPPDAIRWLDVTLRPSWTVLETGMGGSTVFFAQRVASVISYENSPLYFDKTMRTIKRMKLENVTPRFSHAYPKSGLYSLPDGLDLAFIDGRGRVRSAIDVLPHIRPGGWLVLDDAQRDQYEEAVRAADAMSSERLAFCEGADTTMAWRIQKLGRGIV